MIGRSGAISCNAVAKSSAEAAPRWWLTSAASKRACTGGLRRSTHHFILKRKDGARRWISEFTEGLRVGGEDGVVGPLAAWGVAQTIGRAFSKPSSSSYFQMVPYGGNRLTPRRRSRLALTLCPSDPDLDRGPLSLSTPCR
jgi:hypothetical protein